jgi:hypothetical protein
MQGRIKESEQTLRVGMDGSKQACTKGMKGAEEILRAGMKGLIWHRGTHIAGLHGSHDKVRREVPLRGKGRHGRGLQLSVPPLRTPRLRHYARHLQPPLSKLKTSLSSFFTSGALSYRRFFPIGDSFISGTLSYRRFFPIGDSFISGTLLYRGLFRIGYSFILGTLLYRGLFHIGDSFPSGTISYWGLFHIMDSFILGTP